MFLKKISDSGNVSDMIANMNFNFDLLYKQLLQQNNNTSQNIVTNIVTGIDGTVIHTTTDLSNLSNVSTNDLVLISNEHIYNSTTYFIGDLVRLTIDNNTITDVQFILNIKGDKGDTGNNGINTGGALKVQKDNSNNPKLISNYNEYHSVVLPVILGNSNVDVNTSDLLDLLYNNTNDSTSLYIYGNSSGDNTGRLVFLYDDFTPLAQEEYENAPYLKAYKTDNALSLVVRSNNGLKISIKNNFSVTDDVTNYLTVNNTTTSFINDTISFLDKNTFPYLTLKNGNVGILVSDPQYDISVNSNLTFLDTYSLKVNNNTGQLKLNTNGSLTFNSNTPTNLVLNDLEYVIEFQKSGIIKSGSNNDNPTTHLTLHGGDAVRLGAPPNTTPTGGDVIIHGGLGLAGNLEAKIGFAAETQTGSRGGNVLIYGGDSQHNGDVIIANNGTSNVGKVYVGDSIGRGLLNVGGFLSVQNKSTSATVNGMEITIPTTASNGKFLVFKKGDSEIGSISINGITTQYNTTSDSRLKNKIKLANSADILKKLNQVRIWEFNWKNSTGLTEYGVMAQELEHIFPDIVTKPFDKNSYYQVSYQKMIPLLITAIQDLSKHTILGGNTLKQTVTELSTNFNELSIKLSKHDESILDDKDKLNNLINRLDTLEDKIKKQSIIIDKYNELFLGVKKIAKLFE